MFEMNLLFQLKTMKVLGPQYWSKAAHFLCLVRFILLLSLPDAKLVGDYVIVNPSVHLYVPVLLYFSYMYPGLL